MRRRITRYGISALACLALIAGYASNPASSTHASGGLTTSVGSESDSSPAAAYATRTPIKHLVVIFQENVSFDHYFATYPNAQNPAGEPRFTTRPDTPAAYTLQAAGL
ncbi:MAG: hypothetical protein JOZ41_19685, partial [Chloroflexi bacterium]|nr:hypothetical protein [Chloroflexota bacterium]